MMRWLGTIIVVVTFPLWVIPLTAGLLLLSVHRAIWNLPGKYD